jgi:TetR/AcrR family transcriptional regulator, cholesterol catabolism regulator
VCFLARNLDSGALMPKERSRVTTDTSLAERREGRRRGGSRRSDKRWQEILTGAATTFRRIGYANATLEDVAAEVGLNRASLYYYVATKSELLIEVLDKPIFGMTYELAVIEKSQLAHKDKLRNAIRAHMQAISDGYPELFVLLAEYQTLGKDDTEVFANAKRYSDLFTKIIVAGQRAGEIRSEINPRIAMLGILGMCNWTHRWYRENGGMTVSEIGEDFTTIVLDGLQVARTRKRSQA